MCMHTHKRKQYNLILNRLREIRRKKKPERRIDLKTLYYFIICWKQAEFGDCVKWNSIPVDDVLYILFEAKKRFFCNVWTDISGVSTIFNLRHIVKNTLASCVSSYHQSFILFTSNVFFRWNEHALFFGAPNAIILPPVIMLMHF